MSKALTKLCSKHDLVLMEEVVDGDMRYDFYIPTSTPIVIEVNGTQHDLRKADGHFFKTGYDLEKYIKNDYKRKNMDKHGKVTLINFTTEDFPSVEELEEILISHIGDGINENDKFFKKLRRTEDFAKAKKEKNSRQRQEFKRKFNSGDRPKCKLPGLRGIE
jgi:hypothetical protein